MPPPCMPWWRRMVSRIRRLRSAASPLGANIRLQASQNLVAPTRNQAAGLVPDQLMLRRIRGICATTNRDEEDFSGACLAVAAKKFLTGRPRILISDQYPRVVGRSAKCRETRFLQEALRSLKPTE